MQVLFKTWMHMASCGLGGDALRRRQVNVFHWNGAFQIDDSVVETKKPVPRLAAAPQQPTAYQGYGVWRAATIRAYDEASFRFEVKYHDEPKRSQAHIWLPLAVLHYARNPPAAADAVRSDPDSPYEASTHGRFRGHGPAPAAAAHVWEPLQVQPQDADATGAAAAIVANSRSLEELPQTEAHLHPQHPKSLPRQRLKLHTPRQHPQASSPEADAAGPASAAAYSLQEHVQRPRPRKNTASGWSPATPASPPAPRQSGLQCAHPSPVSAGVLRSLARAADLLVADGPTAVPSSTRAVTQGAVLPSRGSTALLSSSGSATGAIERQHQFVKREVPEAPVGPAAAAGGDDGLYAARAAVEVTRGSSQTLDLASLTAAAVMGRNDSYANLPAGSETGSSSNSSNSNCVVAGSGLPVAAGGGSGGGSYGGGRGGRGGADYSSALNRDGCCAAAAPATAGSPTTARLAAGVKQQSTCPGSKTISALFDELCKEDWPTALDLARTVPTLPSASAGTAAGAALPFAESSSSFAQLTTFTVPEDPWGFHALGLPMHPVLRNPVTDERRGLYPSPQAAAEAGPLLGSFCRSFETAPSLPAAPSVGCGSSGGGGSGGGMPPVLGVKRTSFQAFAEGRATPPLPPPAVLSSVDPPPRLTCESGLLGCPPELGSAPEDFWRPAPELMAILREWSGVDGLPAEEGGALGSDGCWGLVGPPPKRPATGQGYTAM